MSLYITSRGFMINGFKVVVIDDRPKMQLSEGIKEFLTPEQIADHNLWMLRFFGVYNWIKDGVTYCIDDERTMLVNPRTFAHIKELVACKNSA